MQIVLAKKSLGGVEAIPYIVWVNGIITQGMKGVVYTIEENPRYTWNAKYINWTAYCGDLPCVEPCDDVAEVDSKALCKINIEN